MLDLDISTIVPALCKRDYHLMIEHEFPDRGGDTLQSLLAGIKELYRWVEPERITGEIIVFQRVQPESHHGAGRPISSFACRELHDLILEIFEDGLALDRTRDRLRITDLSDFSIVYTFQAGIEKIYAKTNERDVIRIDATARSQFAIPTFSNLREALSIYHKFSIEDSSCEIFKQVWNESARLFFVNKPEKKMRQSLTQFLRNRLGQHHDICPETNVDETHPVDIEVRPKMANNRLILIEIKWLGQSLSEDRSKVSTPYTKCRADAGAKQLADYIDSKYQFTPGHVIHGCLVVIDGRRKGLEFGARSISRDDGLHYESDKFDLDPPYNKTRRDFDPPFIMFSRPLFS